MRDGTTGAYDRSAHIAGVLRVCGNHTRSRNRRREGLETPTQPAQCLCLGYALGSLLTSALALVLASLWVARKGVFLSIAVLSLALLWRQLPWLRSLKPAPLSSIPGFFKFVLAAAWLIYGLLYFRFALSPETSFDGMAYHLGLVNLWSHAHGLTRVVDMYAALPSGMEMLFLFAFTIGHHSSAALVHFSFLMLLPVLMVLYGIRFGLRGGIAPFAALVVFVTPLVGLVGSIAYNDIALTVVGFAALYFLQIWRGDRSSPSLIAACALSGFAFAIKYTGCFLCLFVLATIVWDLRRESAARLARTVLVAAALVALARAISGQELHLVPQSNRPLWQFDFSESVFTRFPGKRIYPRASPSERHYLDRDPPEPVFPFSELHIVVEGFAPRFRRPICRHFRAPEREPAQSLPLPAARDISARRSSTGASAAKRTCPLQLSPVGWFPALTRPWPPLRA